MLPGVLVIDRMGRCPMGVGCRMFARGRFARRFVLLPPVGTRIARRGILLDFRQPVLDAAWFVGLLLSRYGGGICIGIGRFGGCALSTCETSEGRWRSRLDIHLSYLAGNGRGRL